MQRMDDARSHRDRAERVGQSLKSAPALTELERKWAQAAAGSAAAGAEAAADARSAVAPVQTAIQSVAAALLFAERPELAGRELLDLLRQSACARHAALVRRGTDGPQTLAAIGALDDERSSAIPPVRVPLGTTDHGDVSLEIDCRDDPQAVATAGAIAALAHGLLRLEKARQHEEAEAALWPIGDAASHEAGETVTSGRMAELMSVARRAGQADLCVLITGESGTGKEVLAREIHQHSTRAGGVFLPFNCSTVPRDMLDSQLFGHRRGAFTGADHDFPGMIRAAAGGTLFLDEIAELGIDLQPKLLRFLESGEICPLGESRPFSVDVRVIAATNARLEQAVEDGRFREDLFYRLNVIRLKVPPLRERREEIPALVAQFVEQASRRARKHGVRLGDDTLDQMLLYRWPGNIRQLQNEVRRMVALADPDTILRPSDLSEGIVRHPIAPAPAPPLPHPPAGQSLKRTIERVEREMIAAALETHRGDLEAAARTLGISRKGLYLKRQRLGL
jgi:DNA-binding NtrC family response regulator